MGHSQSTSAPVNHGVPHGHHHNAPLSQIIRRHGPCFHSCANNKQLYLSTEPSTLLPPQSLVNCLNEIKIWMSTNLLKLNSDKKELLVVAPNPTTED